MEPERVVTWTRLEAEVSVENSYGPPLTKNGGLGDLTLRRYSAKAVCADSLYWTNS